MTYQPLADLAPVATHDVQHLHLVPGGGLELEELLVELTSELQERDRLRDSGGHFTERARIQSRLHQLRADLRDARRGQEAEDS